jgi:hypothetical protein
MTDETELAIAGVTSPHESPPPLGFEGHPDSTTHRENQRGAVESNKFRGGVIAVQRSESQCAWRDCRGLHERANLKSYCGQQTSVLEDGRYRAYRDMPQRGAVSSLYLAPHSSGLFF